MPLSRCISFKIQKLCKFVAQQKFIVALCSRANLFLHCRKFTCVARRPTFDPIPNTNTFSVRHLSPAFSAVCQVTEMQTKWRQPSGRREVLNAIVISCLLLREFKLHRLQQFVQFCRCGLITCAIG